MKQALIAFAIGALMAALIACGGAGFEPSDEKIDGYWDQPYEEFVPPADGEIGVAEMAITTRSGFGVNDHGFTLPKIACDIVTPQNTHNCFYPSSKAISIYLPSGTLPGLTAAESNAFKTAVTNVASQLTTAASGSGFTFTFTNNPNPGGVVLAIQFNPGTGASAGSGMPRYAQVGCVSGGGIISETIPGTYRLCTGHIADVFLHDAFTDLGSVGSAGWNRHSVHVMGYIALEAAGIGSSFTVGNVWNADNVTSATFTGITAQAKACLTSYNLAGGTSSLIRNGSCT